MEHHNHHWNEEKVTQFVKDMEKLVKYRYTPFTNEIVKLLKKRSLGNEITILDVGCGPGFLLFELRKLLTKVRLIGLDASENMLAAAKEKAQKENIYDIEFKRGKVEELPFPDNSIDVVVSQNSLHDFNSVQQALNQIFRVIRSDGCFIDKSRNAAYPELKKKLKKLIIAIRFGPREAKMVFKGADKWLDPNYVIKTMQKIGFDTKLLRKKILSI
jgi:ubiquinone/menaquinone biosynthesis C-methylase UbiE